MFRPRTILPSRFRLLPRTCSHLCIPGSVHAQDAASVFNNQHKEHVDCLALQPRATIFGAPSNLHANRTMYDDGFRSPG
jgi:hypothetical protein